MRCSIEAMVVATRVLAAINDRRPPQPEDVQVLRKFAPLLADSLPVDELACAVIQETLKRKESNELSHQASV